MGREGNSQEGGNTPTLPYIFLGKRREKISPLSLILQGSEIFSGI